MTEAGEYSYICVRILLYMCPHTCVYLQRAAALRICMCPHTPIYIYVLILLYICVSSYFYIYTSPHTPIYIQRAAGLRLYFDPYADVSEGLQDLGPLELYINAAGTYFTKHTSEHTSEHTSAYVSIRQLTHHA